MFVKYIIIFNLDKICDRFKECDMHFLKLQMNITSNEYERLNSTNYIVTDLDYGVPSTDLRPGLSPVASLSVCQ